MIASTVDGLRGQHRVCCTLAAAEASESGEVVAVRGFVGGVSQAPAELPLAGLIGSVLDEGAMLATATSGDGGGQAGCSAQSAMRWRS